jgi:hypothetical protein
MYIIKVRTNKNSSNATATLERVYGNHRERVATSPVRVEYGTVREDDVSLFRRNVENWYQIRVEA